MNNPNPLSPLSPLSQASRGRSNIRIAVISIIALHAVFFGGLLMQGCGKKADENKADGSYGGSSALTATNDLAELPGNPYATPTNFYGSGSLTNAYDPFAASNFPPAYTAPAPATGYQAPAVPVTEPEPTAPGAMREYEIKKGDTLDQIAREHGISLQALRNANPNVDARKLQLKQKIALPASAKAAAGAATTAESGAVTGSSAIHVVKSGETLYAIAKAQGVTVSAIRKANNLKTDTIRVNQKLKLPAGAPAPATTSGAPTNTSSGR